MKKPKEVYFDQYCESCEHKDLNDYENPCNDCLANPGNENSHKPVEYKEKK